VGVQVDQTGGHEFARRAQNLQRPLGGDACFERLDRSKADADVTRGFEILAWVQHLATLDDEIELVVRPHGCDRG
jgi:hypothetical protein